MVMLTRYKIYRGKRPPDEPLPAGIRQDTRRHTNHCLRPTREIVEAYLATPDHLKKKAWSVFEQQYNKLIKRRYDEDRRPFDQLADLAQSQDVYIGCNCPTKQNPEPDHCHTILALRFMKSRYRRLDVHFPQAVKR
jgi:hypothetical protein